MLQLLPLVVIRRGIVLAHLCDCAQLSGASGQRCKMPCSKSTSAHLLPDADIFPSVVERLPRSTQVVSVFIFPEQFGKLCNHGRPCLCGYQRRKLGLLRMLLRSLPPVKQHNNPNEQHQHASNSTADGCAGTVRVGGVGGCVGVPAVNGAVPIDGGNVKIGVCHDENAYNDCFAGCICCGALP